jgi:hypothetical protein
MKKGSLVRAILILALTVSVSVFGRTPPAVTNVWTKTTGGNWSDRSAWSAGRPPAWTHWVAITNENPKTIEINASSVQAFPDSLAMAHLLVATTNTLIIDHPGAPLHIDSGTNIWEGLEVSGGATLRNLASDIRVDGLLRVGYRAQFAQDGGRVEVPRTTYISGNYSLTNGLFRGGYVEIFDSFDQYGGEVETTGYLSMPQFGHYHLFGGQVLAPSIGVKDYSSFEQSGGVVRTPSVGIGVGSGTAAYLLDAGELYTDNIGVYPFMSHVSFEQNGGTVVITNELNLRGSARYYPPVGISAEYLGGSNAVFSARTVLFDQTWGTCVFESAGRVSISENLQFIGDPLYRGNLAILGGTLSCSNLVNDDGVYVNISQEGGSFIVRDRLAIAGYYPGVYGGLHARPARYDFNDGTLAAANIELTAEWSIASSTRPGRIKNTGEFRFGGALIVGDASEDLGRMILIDDSSINMDPGNAKLTFAASNSETWTNSATLRITAWSGSATGGGNDRVIFRGGRAGVTATQLQQIRFVNPVGLPAGEYLAQILDTGELVPAVTREIIIQTTGGNFVVNWSDNRVLQGSNNIEGPYADVATQSPYSVDVNAYPRLFLRLRP